MTKIMFFRPLFYMGGTEIAILNLIRDLNKEKFEIYIGYTDETSDKEILNRLGKYSKKCVNILEETVEVDVLINCSPYSTSTEHFDKIMYSKLFLWFHHFSKAENSIFNDIEHLKTIDKIIVVSEATRATMLKQPYAEFIKDKLEVIYNILNQDEVIEKSEIPISRQLTFGKDLNLITISRLAPEKGFARKIVIAEELMKRNVDFKWFIIGSSYYENIEKEIKDMFVKFEDKFEFLGMQDNPFNLLKECDYLVTLSDDETWGLTITEAKLLGVPCIVSDFDVAYEQIRDMENGIILSRTNTQSYKERIDDVLNNKDAFKKNLEKFEYNINKILQLWEAIL